MKTNILSILLSAALLLSLLCGCTPAAAESGESFDADCTILLYGGSVRISGNGAALDDGEVVISDGGVYRLSGTLTDSRVIVKADDTDDVTLLLDGVDITNPGDEALYIKSAKSARVVLMSDTENILTSGTDSLSLDEGEQDEDASGAALRARCAMTVTGSGDLTVYGYINNGIAADGGLLLDTTGRITVTAVNDAIKSKSDILLADGIFTLTAEQDGVQAETSLSVLGGSYCVRTGLGSEGAVMKVSDSSMMGGGMGGGMPGGGHDRRASGEASGESGDDSTDEIASDELSAETASGEAEIAVDSQPEEQRARGGSPEMGGGPSGEFWDMDNTDSGSHKGLKAGESLVISGGSFLLDCEDDAIHCDGTVEISGGTFVILSGDDGIHGETSLDITGGSIDIQNCYEGLEASIIRIADGFVSIVASDDGMNANGGGFGFPGGPSREASNETAETGENGENGEDEGPLVRISGGTVIVDSGGDGLDSNGDMYIDGGLVCVSGPSTNWDAAIDSGEGAEFIIRGGILLAAGYSGMFERPEAAADSQPSIYYQSSDYAPDGAVMTLKDADGRTLVEYSFAHSYNAVLVSTPDLTVGGSYTLTIDGISADISLTSVTYTNRSFGASGGPGGMRG